MTNSYWALCAEALDAAFRQHNHAEAVRLLGAARENMELDGLSDELKAKRQQYIELLESQIQGVINVLFVLPDSIDSSYGYGVLNVVKGLASQKVKFAVAVPKVDGGIAPSAALSVKSFAEIKRDGPGFPGSGKPDIIHAWTAQELVREFCAEVQEKYSAKLVVHIQDNEEYLAEKILGKPWKKLQAMPEPSAEKIYFHPHHGTAWLSKVGGFTYAIDTLKRFNLASAPTTLLQPALDEGLFYPRPRNAALRDKLGIPQEHTVIVYPGVVRAANQEEIRQLYQAVDSLNRQGIPTTLVRTGRNRDPRVVAAWPSDHVKDMGWVARKELPEIMAVADIFAQPGVPGPYNDQRFPAKLLEFFSLGRPVILPRTNLGLKAVHRQDAYILDKADADGIAVAVAQIKADQKLCDSLTKGAVDFYLAHAGHNQYPALYQLYQTVLNPDQKAAGSKLTQQAMNTGEDKPRLFPPAPPIPHAAADSGEIKKLQSKIKELELDKIELSKRLRSMPSIDPLCVSDPGYTPAAQDKEDFGVVVFGHTRLDALGAVLESLKRQDALKYTEVWLDGYQGRHDVKLKIEKTVELVKKYQVKHLHRQSGNFGFRKMLILGLTEMCRKYRDILILEDDCFPTRDAVSEFRKELDLIRNNDGIFSVYGHHFLVESEKETCSRFQGWGWATTSEKLTPMLRQLIDCYSMTEERYLEFVRLTLTPDIKRRIDITPPRLPSYVLENFFAWDETLCLLAALNNQNHRPTRKRTIYNCGMGEDSTHFDDTKKFRSPPFNLITPKEVWQYF
jgi:glycosyltransferase involved in cell wall biosynthesis